VVKRTTPPQNRFRAYLPNLPGSVDPPPVMG
jgi:hypothetical protein